MHACGLAMSAHPSTGDSAAADTRFAGAVPEVSAAVAGVVEFLPAEQRRIVSAASGRVLWRSRV